MSIKETTLPLPFVGMPETAKIWVYQANRPLSEQEETFIQEKASTFVQGWESHGSKLKAAFALLHGRFLLFTVDEEQHEASGCSIDKSVHFVKELQNTLAIDFFDRTVVSYFAINGDLALAPLSKIKDKVNNGEINSNTLIFNTLISNLGQFPSEWVLPAGQSWLSRFF